MKKLVSYFLNRSLVANTIFLIVFVLAFFSYTKIPKEEKPNFSFGWVRLIITYPGASAENVELFVTRPIEEEIQSVRGTEAPSVRYGNVCNTDLYQ